MDITLSLPEELASQITELSNQKGESLESIMLTAISYYVFISKQIKEDWDQRKVINKQEKLKIAQKSRGKFKGCLSSSEEFAQTRRFEKELEL